ncbi:DUF2530 domain-containing protein [Planomonospora corallina]|uniref:DUF2530 domain-containing protein n=1 Tax=Planomonospora corallina TaxID=1806052 RepID=A0ABV8IA73_9ACTN
MNQPRRQDLQPLRTNNTATILTGMGLWAVALAVLLIVGLDPEDRWWIWTCVAALVLGLFGLWYVRPRPGAATPTPPDELPPAEEPVEPATAVPPSAVLHPETLHPETLHPETLHPETPAETAGETRAPDRADASGDQGRRITG